MEYSVPMRGRNVMRHSQSPLRFDVTFWQNHDIVEIPTYCGDCFDLITGATGFNLAGLGLDRGGLKVFDFHPNIVFINAGSDADYLATKSFYTITSAYWRQDDPEKEHGRCYLNCSRQSAGMTYLLLRSVK